MPKDQGVKQDGITLLLDDRLEKGFYWNKKALEIFENNVGTFFFKQQINNLIQLIGNEPGVYQYVGRYAPNNDYGTFYLGSTETFPNLIGISIENLLNNNPSNSKKNILAKLLECMPEKHKNDFKVCMEDRRKTILRVAGVTRLDPFYFLINNTNTNEANPKGYYLAAFNEVRLPESKDAPDNKTNSKNSFLVCGFQYVSISEEIYQSVASKPLAALPTNEQLLSFLYDLKTKSLQSKNNTSIVPKLFLPLTNIMEKILEERAKASQERTKALEKYQECLKKELERTDVSLVDIKLLVDEVKEAEALIQQKARALIQTMYDSTVKENTEVSFYAKVNNKNGWLMVSWYPQVAEGLKSKPLERCLGNTASLINKIIIKIKDSIISTFLESVTKKILQNQKTA